MEPFVMVVDDDKEMRNILAMMLKNSGYQSITASNGLEACELLKKCSSPSLIITDYAMPLMNGKELIERLTAQSQYRDIPVIMITASEIEYVLLPKSANLKAVIQKPFILSMVLDIVKIYSRSEEAYQKACQL